MGKFLGLFLVIGFGWALTLPENFSAIFIQKIINPKGKTLLYRGRLYYKGKRVFWHYKYPVEKKIWITPLGYIAYEPDLMQVTISQKPLNLNLSKILKGAKQVGAGLYIAEVDGKKVYFRYNSTLEEINYTDEVGNRVLIRFVDPSTKPIPREQFQPSFPAEVDKIYQ